MTDIGGGTAMSTGRVEAFSDGVFAIAITLLVLEIRLPEEPRSHAHLWEALWGLWPSYLAYVVTFLLIGMIWMNHHRMFNHIRRVDGMLLALNLLLLMDVAFLPFPTHVLAEAITAGEGASAAAVFYGAILVIGGLFFNGLWWYASSRHRHLGDGITPAEARALRIRWGVGPLLYLVATAVGVFSAIASLCLYVFLLAFYFFDMRPRTSGA
ncbi:TMEM175 family protein [Streptosporangium sp. CA-135522]|uniref:TMEM175 family protein n=1 Tax=Streptosporangium sp. CA-135522 TaxID=3240072 RepID=UPI003D91278C